MKEVIVIAAVSRNGVYSKGGTIPWHSEVDLKKFKNETRGHTVVMGLGTWSSLPNKNRPLPGCANIVVTQTPQKKITGATCVKSLTEAIEVAKTRKVYVIGGDRLWYEAMEIASQVLVTIVEIDVPIDETTKFMSDFINVYGRWPQYYFDNSVKEIEQADGEMFWLTFCHWQRHC